MFLHEFANGGGRIRLQVADGFTKKRKTHVPWWKIESVLLPFDENEEQD